MTSTSDQNAFREYDSIALRNAIALRKVDEARAMWRRDIQADEALARLSTTYGMTESR